MGVVSSITTKTTMTYGTSERYEGHKGEEYFAYQNRKALAGAKSNARKFLPHIEPGSSVIDFGCGGGWVLRELPCALRVGVELNEAAHDVCRSNGVTVYRVADEVAERNFDAAISHHCLEHVPCPVNALRFLHSVLRPGGLLVLVLPLDDWRAQRDHTGKDIDHHLHTWTPRLLANTLVEAGFSVERIGVLTHAWFPGFEKVAGTLPVCLADFLCRLMSIATKRRQLLALARKPA